MGEDRQDSPGQPSSRRVSVQEAAQALDTTVDAIRKRAQRGTIAHEKDTEGRVWILLDTGQTGQDSGQDTTGRGRCDLLEAKDEIISELRAHVGSLERQLEARAEEIRRRDILLGEFVRRVPELEAPAGAEAPSEPPGSPETATPQPGRIETPIEVATEEPSSRRSWWRRMFGG